MSSLEANSINHQQYLGLEWHNSTRAIIQQNKQFYSNMLRGTPSGTEFMT